MPRARAYSKRDRYSGRAYWITPIPDAPATEHIAGALVRVATANHDLWTILTPGNSEPPGIGPVPKQRHQPAVGSYLVDEKGVPVWGPALRLTVVAADETARADASSPERSC